MKPTPLLLITICIPLGAQWLNYPDPQTPRTKDGKPNLNAPAPRANGKPDLSGVWQAERTPIAEYRRVMGADVDKIEIDLDGITKYTFDVFWDVKPEDHPLRPETAAMLKERDKSPPAPGNPCLPSGVPVTVLSDVVKLIQTPREIVVIDEGDPPQQIYLDGRRFPAELEPSWTGYSTGRWDGNTMVVETVGVKVASNLDIAGHPRSEAMKVTQRYHRRDFGHMDLEVTFDDPKYYTRPFSVKTVMHLLPDSDVLEYVCAENEKDSAHLR